MESVGSQVFLGVNGWFRYCVAVCFGSFGVGKVPMVGLGGGEVWV